MNVTIKPHGRAGNQIIQYFLGKILAKKKICNFAAPKIQPFEIEVDEYQENDLPTINTGIFGKHYYDLQTLVNYNGNIIIDSYCQQCKEFLKYRKFLQKEFQVKNNLIEYPEDDELVMHIRATDYKENGAYLGDNFYKQFLIEHKDEYRKVSLITDNIEAPLIRDLVKLGCVVKTPGPCMDWYIPRFNNNDLHDYNYMLHAKHLFISQSSFSWVPAFLGDHHEIIFPYKSSGKNMWPIDPKKDEPNLYFDFNNKSRKYIL